MKLYLNDDTEGIDIISYKHMYIYEFNPVEKYNIELDPQVNINNLAIQYGNVIITKLIIKNQDEIIRNISNLNLKINLIQNDIEENMIRQYLYLTTNT